MKIKFDKEKSVKALSNLAQGTVDLSKKTAANVKTSVAAMREKSKAEEYERRIKKYNPLFPEQYQNESFKVPNIVVIVDDAIRKGIDVCEGAIGWLGNETNEEVLYLYDEAVAESGITFIPAPICNAVYCVDHFDRGRFIQADCIFARTLKEKLDELQNIAECLGAKYCSILVGETSRSSKTKSSSSSFGISKSGVGENTSSENEQHNASDKYQRGHVEVRFGEAHPPKRPTLKWFQYDDSIVNLVETCCTGKRRVEEMTLELSGSTSTTMSQSTACAIDGVMGKSLKVKGGVSMQQEAQNEFQSVLNFHTVF